MCCLLLALAAPSVAPVARHDYNEGFGDFCAIHGTTVAEGLVLKFVLVWRATSAARAGQVGFGPQ